ncbi:hypothetical protein AB0M45_20840 [Nocardia sp. NPDC051787]|uniref:hypothetical protein n=1 Tax=Nocardia sp. NPDC051787 TaxID=3155415 RepID=UPI00344348D6
MKPISTTTTLLIPLLFVLGVVSAPPVAAHPYVAEHAPGACAGSVCLPSLPGLLRRAPFRFRQSDTDTEDERLGARSASLGVSSCEQAEPAWTARMAPSAVSTGFR